MLRKNQTITAVAVACGSAYALITFPSIVAAQTPIESRSPDNHENMQAAISIAKKQLAKQHDIDSSTLNVISSEPFTWPDSSLGCAKPGQMSSQVMTPGFVVTIESDKGTFVLHATTQRAVMCDQKPILRMKHEASAPLRNIESMIAEARNDLATQLHARPELIRTVNFAPIEWNDTSMDCPVDGETIQKQVVKGYRIALNHQGRTYVYHTDMSKVRACPPIAAQ
jgi:hypothetical protein